MIYVSLNSNYEVISVSSSEFPGSIEVDDTYDYGDHHREIITIKDGKLHYEEAEWAKALKVKGSKESDVSSIKVTTSTDKTFDGDEKSQDRMMRAIQTAGITGLTTTQWKLANNTVVEVTLDELKEALALAAQEMSRIWMLPEYN